MGVRRRKAGGWRQTGPDSTSECLYWCLALCRVHQWAGDICWGLAPFVAEGILGVLAEHKLINGKEALRWKSLFLTLWMGPDFQTCSPVGNSWLRIHSIQRNGVFSSDQGSCSLNCRLSLVSSAVVLVGDSHLRCTDFEFFFSLPLYPYAFLLKLCFLFSAVQLFYSVRNIFHLFHDVVPTYHK